MKDCTNGGLEKARQFASETGQLEQFEDILKRLAIREEGENVGNMGRKSEVILYPDFTPYSFFWVWQETESKRQIMCGGMIYHGKHDGGGNGGVPTFSVCLELTSGWRIHT